jgi:hypothetical protein
LVWKKVEVLACFGVALIATAGRLAIATTPAPPTRNLRRDGEALVVE